MADLARARRAGDERHACRSPTAVVTTETLPRICAPDADRRDRVAPRRPTMSVSTRPTAASERSADDDRPRERPHRAVELGAARRPALPAGERSG
jgi:hypothetical protein